ncbi:TPA: ABC transporter ATP-binding protein [Clostridioides difficile]|uniref:ABC-type transport system, multidrug-family ATP-binding protein/permease n=3 Tax=Clostridioides difficile TaxID=1496 RepID=Q18BZ2_CLOD6|nr:ABC transporter ATP-binding protein [Clostridioides difficile]EQF75242.1 ABC transporter family protein [Clostridioides difficile CD196]CCL64351.1 ABC-type transport system, multidrug-family ATP-binding protein/permease [Clostridioides difficile E7]AJP11175.1 ABC-type transport system, multidrug-family ATP-binding protein / permease [Clostridioides difficile 630]ARE62398.1 ABC-type transport system, multidrug-family ATP-binding protein / permease [Clostridioides difficile]AXB64295.1 ABC tra
MRYFKKYIKKYIVLFLTAVFFLTLEAFCDLAQPTIMAKIIDIGVSNKNLDYILSTGAIMIGITFLGAIFAIIRSVISARVSQHFSYDLRQDVFEKINTYSLKQIDKFGRASLITRITNDINQMQQFVNGMMRVFIKSPIMCIGSLIIAIKLNLKMSIIILIAVLIIFIIILLNMKIGYRLFKNVQESTDKVNSKLRQFLSGIKVVKLFCRYDYENQSFEELNDELFKNSRKATTMMSFFRPTITIIINVSIIIILLIGRHLIYSGEIKIGIIVAYVNYMTRILTSLIMISHVFNVFVRAKASYERISEVLVDENEEVIEREESLDVGEKDLKFVNCDIIFENVDFSYNKTDEKILKNVSFKIEEGQNIGVIGQTGSGKTSLVNLIQKLYIIDKGDIKIGGRSIYSISEESLRKRIGVVFQNSSVFGKSILENVVMGNRDICKEDVVKSCEIANANQFITKLENTYDEVLFQRGKNLSGGQRQRITIARAIAKKPQILILDDCFSAMDINTETIIRKNIKEYISNLREKESKKCTVITISQKISSIIDCDKILVLDEGEVVGFATHEDLLVSSPIYKKIFALQNLVSEDVN